MKKILLAATIATLSACSAKKDEQPTKTIGMVNPASVYCEKIGGKLDIVNEKDGQVGYCTLPSSERIEEWTLFKKDHK